MKLINEANIFQQLKQKIDTNRMVNKINDPYYNENIYKEMIDDIVKKGKQDKNLLRAIIPYLKEGGVNKAKNKVYQLLINSDFAYNIQALDFIGRLTQTNLDMKILTEIVRTNNINVMKALYYANQKGIDFKLLRDYKYADSIIRYLPFNKIVDVIEDELKNKKQSTKVEEKDIKSLGYDISDVENEEGITTSNIAPILYYKAFELNPKNIVTLLTSLDLSEKEKQNLPALDTIYKAEIGNYWKDKFNVKNIPIEKLIPDEKVLKTILTLPKKEFIEKETERIKKIIDNANTNIK